MKSIFKSRCWYIFPVLLLAFMILSSMCPNKAPVISSLTATPNDLDWGGTSQIVVVASDEEGDPLTYFWTCSNGVFTTPTTGTTVTWQAPNVSGSFTVTVDVSDGESTTSQSITLTVNGSPTVTVTAVPIALFCGQTSTITAIATDPDGDALTYSWTATGGIFTSATTTASVIWQAPGTTGSFTVTVTVSDGVNSVSVSVTITVTTPPGQWLKYDDESYEGYLETNDEVWFVLTLFDRPAGWVDYKVTEVRVNFNTDGDPDGVAPCCWDVLFDSGYYWPNTEVYYNEPEYDVVNGWNTYTVDWDLSLERFCAGYFQLYYATDPDPYFDDSDPDTRAYLIDGPDGNNLTANLFNDIDWAIQVYVEHAAPGAAGGREGMWLEGKKITIKNHEQSTHFDLPAHEKSLRKVTGMRKKL